EFHAAFLAAIESFLALPLGFGVSLTTFSLAFSRRLSLPSLAILLFKPFRMECLLSLRGPKVPRMLGFLALQLGGDPE
ncbi:MAG: hypothetical protein J0I92_15870, partial [Phyllobacterium sp.]|nr:hypothetical protein [Phyllobacterium sp.]